MTATKWKERLGQELKQADVVAVVIGPKWIEEFSLRSADSDQVLWEVATALNLNKVMIPILISGASMPTEGQLHPSIVDLLKFNTLTVASTKSEELTRVLEDILRVIDRERIANPERVHSGIRRLLNSDLNLLDFYHGESKLLRVEGSQGEQYTVPAIELLNAENGLEENTISIEYVPEPFTSNVGSHAAFDIYKADAVARGKAFYSTKTARICALNHLTGPVLKFQPTSYFDYVKTNMAMDYEDLVSGTLREEVHGKGILEPLSRSKLANHTGVSGLVFSNDGKMIIQKRSPKVFTNPNQLSPGFSGTLTANDIAQLFKKGTLQSNLHEVDVLRELVEELGVDEVGVVNRCFMGLSRELLRGGLPELFYAVDLNMSADEVLGCFAKDREGETLSMPLRYARARLSPEEANYLQGRFSNLLIAIEEHGKAKASIPLITNLAFWVNQHRPPLAEQP